MFVKSFYSSVQYSCVHEKRGVINCTINTVARGTSLYSQLPNVYNVWEAAGIYLLIKGKHI